MLASGTVRPSHREGDLLHSARDRARWQQSGVPVAGTAHLKRPHFLSDLAGGVQEQRHPGSPRGPLGSEALRLLALDVGDHWGFPAALDQQSEHVTLGVTCGCFWGTSPVNQGSLFISAAALAWGRLVALWVDWCRRH